MASPDLMIRVMGRNEYCIYSLLWVAEQQGQAPVSRNWLVDRMPENTSPGTVTEVLKKLTSKEWQLVVRVPKGWRLSGEGRAQPPCYRATQEYEAEPAGPRGGRPMLEAGAARGSPHDTSGEPETGGIAAEELKVRLAVLHEFEVTEPKAGELARLEWATPGYIRAQMERAQRECARDDTVQHPVGLAIWRIQQHFPMPKKGGADRGKGRGKSHVEEDRGRYTRGEYAEFIEQ